MSCTVDVEDYFHAEAFSDVVDRARWDSYTSRVVPNTRRLLELLARSMYTPRSSFWDGLPSAFPIWCARSQPVDMNWAVILIGIA